MAEDTEVEVMVVVVVMAMVAEEDLVEVSMVKNHMNFPAGMEQLCQKLVYTMHTNGDYSPRSKILLLKKWKFLRDGEAFTFLQEVTN